MNNSTEEATSLFVITVFLIGVGFVFMLFSALAYGSSPPDYGLVFWLKTYWLPIFASGVVMFTSGLIIGLYLS